MKYFLDTEFIESFHRPLFGKRRHFIDLISIGLVREDGLTYEAISSEWNYKDADQWVRDNVIHPLYTQTVHGDVRNHIDATNFHQRGFGRRNSAIAMELRHIFSKDTTSPIEIYGYYADYDWVLLCSLFGRMIDLPKGMPMYCRDLKQMMDERRLTSEWKDMVVPEPKNAHNALNDALWCHDLYRVLKSVDAIRASILPSIDPNDPWDKADFNDPRVDKIISSFKNSRTIQP